jgi:transposase
MENKTIILTRKIQLLIDTEDPAILKDARDKLYHWQNISFRAANMIMTHHFAQENIKDFFYLTEGIKLKLSHQEKDENGIFTSSRSNTIYRVLSGHFKGEIPTNVLSNLNNRLTTCFNKEKAAYWKGERSLRNYKKNLPIPFGPEVMYKFQHTPDKRNFSFNLFQIPFRTYLGKDQSDKKQMLEKVKQGLIQLRTSSLQLDKGKVFLLATFRLEQQTKPLDESVIAEASLSLEYPITVTIDKESFTIGTKEEFLHRRIAIQSARQRIQKGAAFNRPGKGRKRKLKAVADYGNYEQRYINYKLHLYSKKLIDLCIKYHAATLILLNQGDKEEVAREDPFILQNWSYFSLMEKIKYKANMAGITVVVE